MKEPSISVGDDEFYSSEILDNTDLVLPDNLTVIAFDKTKTRMYFYEYYY